MEIEAGDCALSFAVAERVRQVYAIDVSDEITRARITPANFQLVLADGCSIPLPAGSVSLAYSNQLMEHLHPDDAVEQLQNIRLALAPGGLSIRVTLNRLTGPRDVSRSFDRVATGFHLREYAITELVDLFRRVAFMHMRAYVGAKGISMRFPIPLLRAYEWAMGGCRARSGGGRPARGCRGRFSTGGWSPSAEPSVGFASTVRSSSGRLLPRATRTPLRRARTPRRGGEREESQVVRRKRKSGRQHAGPIASEWDLHRIRGSSSAGSSRARPCTDDPPRTARRLST